MHRIHREQIFRASSSIVLNLAEGSGKRTQEDQRRYYANALGSLRECQAILELEKIEGKEIFEIMNALGAMLFKLAKANSNPRRKQATPDTNSELEPKPIKLKRNC